MQTLINLLNAAVRSGTPLLLATSGEILTEKSGNLNLGVEGIMYMGAIGGLGAAWYFEQWFGGGAIAAVACFVIAFLLGLLGSLIYSILTTTLRANQNVTGLTLTIFGTGFAKYFGEHLGNQAGGYVAVSKDTTAIFNYAPFAALKDIPVVGPLLFSYNWMVYLAIVFALVMGWFLNHTRKGLMLRSVGEDPATADTAGISVSRYRYGATLIGGGLGGLGGMYMAMVGQNGIWATDCVSGYGWLAIALVIFATWSPLRAIYCAIIFGGLDVMYMYFPIKGLPTQIYISLPYIVTILVLIFTSMRQSKEHSIPAGTGLNYYREDR
ncbi:MAG: ABC transporter permease [Saccharofermentanales bacterium]